MIDIVVPLSSESNWGDNELRYALRSFEKHFNELGNIYIIGHLPTWILNVRHIECEDIYLRNKDANIISKVLKSCYDEKVSENFIFLSDDQCLLSNKIVQDFYPRYCLNLKDFPFRDIQNHWRDRLENTYKKLKNEEKTTWHFDSHHPVLINKYQFIEIMSKYNWQDEGGGYTINTLYFNNIIDKFKWMVEFEGDQILKFQRVHQFTEMEILDKSFGKDFLTYDDRGLNESLKSFLENKFNKKSKYE